MAELPVAIYLALINKQQRLYCLPAYSTLAAATPSPHAYCSYDEQIPLVATTQIAYSVPFTTICNGWTALNTAARLYREVLHQPLPDSTPACFYELNNRDETNHSLSLLLIVDNIDNEGENWRDLLSLYEEAEPLVQEIFHLSTTRYCTIHQLYDKYHYQMARQQSVDPLLFDLTVMTTGLDDYYKAINK